MKSPAAADATPRTPRQAGVPPVVAAAGWSALQR
jgi:hypothetical protein